MSTKLSWDDVGFTTIDLVRAVSRHHSSVLNKNETAVLKVLIEYMKPWGDSWPGVETIAKEVGLSSRTVLRTLKSLSGDGKGYLTRKRRQSVSTVYRLNTAKILSPVSDNQDPVSDNQDPVSDNTGSSYVTPVSPKESKTRESKRVVEESAHASVLPANWQDDEANWFTYTPEQRRELVDELNKEDRRKTARWRYARGRYVA